LRVSRQLQVWFEPNGGIESFLPDRFPIWLWETRDGDHPYGLPALEGASGGVKVALHHGGKNPTCTPDTIDRTVSEEEILLARRTIAPLLPALDGRFLRAVTCLYTNTPDEHFIIDRHPAHPQVLIVSPCSGHGFKFCAVVGEIVADLVEQNRTRHPIGLFQLGRLNRDRPPPRQPAAGH
jgi:sarcosine oxidase